MFSEEKNAVEISKAEAERLARELYGLTGTAKRLPGEYDCNFYLRTTDGHEFVLKCMHPARDAAFIEMQCDALAHLATHAPRLPLPRTRPSIRSQCCTVIEDAAAQKRVSWLLEYIPGDVLAKVNPHTPELFAELGEFLGELDQALTGFSHPATRRELKWNMSSAGWISEHIGKIVPPERRELVEYFVAQFGEAVQKGNGQLRKAVIYGDANDYNVIVSPAEIQQRRIAGLIDFGDMHEGWIASEPAIAAAYAILGKTEPLEVACQIVGGFHRANPLNEAEIAAIFPFMGMRLAVSVVNSAIRATHRPGDAYLTVSENAAWEALARLRKIHARFAEYAMRSACGLVPAPQSEKVMSFLREQGKRAKVLQADLRETPLTVFDLSVGSTLLGADPASAKASTLTRTLFEKMRELNVTVGVGRYDEARLLYTSELFGAANARGERRTIHLGLDLFIEAGSEVVAPLDGTVFLMADNRAPLDYGPMVILRHSTTEGADGQEFFTLYGHLSRESLKQLRVGQQIRSGEVLGQVGTLQENGGWPAHLHFQIILDLLNYGTDFPGVALASQRDVWTSLSPDPNLLLGIAEEKFPAPESSAEEAVARRKEVLGGNLSVSYQKPLKLVRGWLQYLYDETGRAFLDVYNNVPLVGHSHPRVVRAAQEQLALLNTNTRYLHENILRYAERLTALMPDPLRVCYVLNSGSEANELALRLARAYTRCEDVIVLEHAYHGHTSTLIDISPYKFDGPGGTGKKPWVHVAPLADDYRGIYRRGQQQIGAMYAEHIRQMCRELQLRGRRPTFIAEMLPSVGGQIVFPPQYLAEAYRHVRGAGGVCIADEVQVGFGRLGSHFWGFETQCVVPDIVVLGKPIGNGFPLAAVITTREIATAFDNGMEFFSTFGGNPVACAAGMAVLDVLEEERLQENALRVGESWIAMLKKIQENFPLIGDVRGAGLFLGLDLVTSRESREAATRQASYIVNRLREEGILAGTDGPLHNVVKLRPPLIFSHDDAKYFCAKLSLVLEEDAAQSACAPTVRK